MYYSANRLVGFALHALDGMTGRIADLCFEEKTWSVRYLAVELAQGRRILVAAPLLGRLDLDQRTVDVHLERAQLENSPELGGVSASLSAAEKELLAHYGWPSYWNGFSADNTFGEANPWLPHPEELGMDHQENGLPLRSAQELVGYRLEARDGVVGRIEDLIFDDEVWQVRYLVTRTRTWLPGRKILLQPGWVEAIHREEAEVLVDHGCDDVRNSPELPDPDA